MSLYSHAGHLIEDLTGLSLVCTKLSNALVKAVRSILPPLGQVDTLQRSLTEIKVEQLLWARGFQRVWVKQPLHVQGSVISDWGSDCQLAIYSSSVSAYRAEITHR